MAEKSKKIYIIILKVAACLLLCGVLLPVLLYIPFIQDFAKNIAVKQVSEATGWKLSLDRIRLRFPLSVGIDNLIIEQAENDTLLAAKELLVDVKLLPLIKKQIDVNSAELNDGKFSMLSDDESVSMYVTVDNCRFENTSVNLNDNSIKADEALLDGGYMTLDIDLEKSVPSESTSKSSPWKISAGKLEMRDITYKMTLLPYIDSLSTDIACAKLENGYVDTGKRIVNAHSFTIDSVDCTYFTPSYEYLASHPEPVDTTSTTSTSPSRPWTITSDIFRLTNSHAIYAVRDVNPQKGLDMDYYEGSDINIAVDSFYNRGRCIKVPIRELRGHERCGITIASMSGCFEMDSTSMYIDSLNITTDKSELRATASVERAFFKDKNTGHLHIDAEAGISVDEAEMLYPAIEEFLPGMTNKKLAATLLADGNLHRLQLKQLNMSVPGVAIVSAKGYVSDLLDMKKIDCNLAFYGQVGEANFLKPALFSDSAMRQNVNFAPMKLDGEVHATNGSFMGDATLALESGDVVFDAAWDGKETDYELRFDAMSLPVTELLPTSRIQYVSAQGFVKGHGLDFFDKETNVTADINVDTLIYNRQTYYNISLNGLLANGDFNASLTSSNTSFDFTTNVNGYIEPDHYVVSVMSTINDINLYALNVLNVASNGSCNLYAYADIDMKNKTYETSLNLEKLRWTHDVNYYYTDMIEMEARSDSTRFYAHLINNDFNIDVNADCNLDTLLSRFTSCADIAMEQIENKSVNIDTLQDALPPFTCEINMDSKNLVQQYVENNGIKLRHFDCKIANDSTIYMFGRINNLDMSGIKLDTIYFGAIERNKQINYRAHIGNREGTMANVAAADLRGMLEGSKIRALFTQHDFDKKEGFKIGVNAELNDTTIKVGIFPNTPIIGYKTWTVNEDNNISYNYLKKHFDANMILRQDNSEVSLLTEHSDEISENGTKQEDISLTIKNVQISDWLAFSPFSPPLSGILGTNLKVKYDGKNIWGDGEFSLDNVKYDRRAVGNFELNTLIDLDPEGGTVATANLEVNGHQCVVAFGSINDTIAAEPFLLALELDRFPLSVANAFLPKGMAEITGNLDGLMKVTGSPSEPILNGYIQCSDSTKFTMPVFGSSINLPTEKLPVDSNVIKLNQYAIKGINGSPLILDGIIDASNFDNPYLDLTMAGENVQFVSAKQTRKSEIFGRGFVDIDTSVKGYMSSLDVYADIALLSGSNITYVLQNDVSTIAEQHEQKIVKFVQFNDSSYVLADSLVNSIQESSMNLNVALNIETGTILNVFLSKNGIDRAEVHGNGDLLYSVNRLGDQSLTGQYNIESGYVRYSPPLISQKHFVFNSDSYLRWNGDMSDPILHLSAYETHKTNVTQDNAESRLVNFIISLNVTNSLSNMNATFDLSTNDDITIQNELSSMSAAQRSSQAVNLLLYNTYTGTDTKASGNLSGNPVFSFLTSQLNNWAASALKGINVSFGFDNYNQVSEDGVSTKQVRYSYEVSKSLFDDRFKIVIGGNYSPSTTSGEEIAKNLFNDVSLEYMLNKSGNMYVRLFNHTGYTNVFEGKVTQTGVAFVYKRKLTNLKNIFRFRTRKKKSNATTVKTSNDPAILPTEKNDSISTKNVNSEL